MTDCDIPMLRRWLLHQLPEEQAQLLEQRLLQESEFGACLQTVETDLLDDYVRNRLNPADRSAVATHLIATPPDRDRLRFAAALARYTEQKVPDATHAMPELSAGRPRLVHRHHRRRILAWSGLAAACAALLAVGIWNYRTSVAPGAAMQPIVTIALADPTRGASITTVCIPHDANTVRLQTEVAANAPGTRYTLTVANGRRTLFEAHGLTPLEAGPYRYVQAVMKTQTLGRGKRRVSVSPKDSTAAATVWIIQVDGATTERTATTGPTQ